MGMKSLLKPFWMSRHRAPSIQIFIAIPGVISLPLILADESPD